MSHQGKIRAKPVTEEIMEQKAKRIGKLNIIDLIAIVLIVAVLALAAWKFIGKNGDSISYDRPQTKVTYQVKVEGVAPGTV